MTAMNSIEIDISKGTGDIQTITEQLDKRMGGAEGAPPGGGVTLFWVQELTIYQNESIFFARYRNRMDSFILIRP